jgi:hypothetical protein
LAWLLYSNTRSTQGAAMFADADHEVIDSPEALFRHLYEEHGVEEARDLDPDSAPVQFWLRRHSELERAQRTARRDPDPPPEPQARPQPQARVEPAARSHRGAGRPEARPQPASRPQPEPKPQPGAGRGPVRQDVGVAAGRDGRRPAGFGDPLVEAVARALAGRGHDEGAVRSAIRSFAGPNGSPSGEAGIRAVFVEPMLQSVAGHLLGAARPDQPAIRPQPPPAAPAARTQPSDPGPAATSAPPDAPTHPSPGPDPAVRPEAAWAVLWADLGETGKRAGTGGGSGGGDDGDDLMAVANAVQQRRRVRLLRR